MCIWTSFKWVYYKAKRCTLFKSVAKKLKNVCPKLRSLISKLSPCPHRWRCLLKGAFLWEATLLPILSNPPCFRPQKDDDFGLGLEPMFSTSYPRWFWGQKRPFRYKYAKIFMKQKGSAHPDNSPILRGLIYCLKYVWGFSYYVFRITTWLLEVSKRSLSAKPI